MYATCVYLYSCVCVRLNKIPTAMGPSEVNGMLQLLAALKELTRMEEIEWVSFFFGKVCCILTKTIKATVCHLFEDLAIVILIILLCGESFRWHKLTEQHWQCLREGFLTNQTRSNPVRHRLPWEGYFVHISMTPWLWPVALCSFFLSSVKKRNG